MDKRFANLFGLTEEESIALLDTPEDKLAEDDSRYVAAAQLASFATEQSIDALIRAIHNNDPSLNNRITRRKSVESLGKLQVNRALPAIRTCLADDDCYTVENAVWAIGEIGTEDLDILEEIAKLLEKPGQSYRVIIHTLRKFDYKPGLERIRKFLDDDDAPIASAANAAVYQFTGDDTYIEKVMGFLQDSNVYGRRLSIQDLVDVKYYKAIDRISQCPVSVVFRLRGIRLLGEAGIPVGAIAFSDIQPSLEAVIYDRPKTLKLVHEYDQIPTLEFAIKELYEVDFGRCYLATKTILESYADTAGQALMATYAAEACNDYGANYHVIKALGWIKYAPAYDLFIEALHNTQPQFQKSRAAAAIALGELGDNRAIGDLKVSLETKIWDLKYAALLSLARFGDNSGRDIAAKDTDWLIQAKANS
ncbi:HEAT repeat domain-containing protein [Limnofasciculus baicalensis]|uniref:HEAT repeat domain-containing protein n=1 Tax=Limnofasciculus baicalensis BBK-W-15 TaxID=2699891 RepID=A0AAE3GYS2_9CYAN|nr:HEAT repeat domain-containing protein [Limnofasciculus baicalensis]MCP2732276.1 HEAT repeat domain-containing protein [Limnofasciculus baicalensis BBK-W-15]